MGFNARPLKFIHNSFNPGATELKPLPFYSGHPEILNDVLCKAKISSQANQRHLVYTKEA